MSGCAREPQVVTEIQTKRIEPPQMLLSPRMLPGPPPVPQGQLEVEDMINWYETWINSLEQAASQSEADKAAIREWIDREDNE